MSSLPGTGQIAMIFWDVVPSRTNIGYGGFSLWAKSARALMIVVFHMAHASLLLLIRPQKSIVTYALYATLVCISIGALIMVFHLFVPVFHFEGVLLLVGFAVLNIFGGIVTVILHKIYSSRTTLPS